MESNEIAELRAHIARLQEQSADHFGKIGALDCMLGALFETHPHPKLLLEALQPALESFRVMLLNQSPTEAIIRAFEATGTLATEQLQRRIDPPAAD